MLSFLYVYSDHSILECYNLFSGVELSMRSFFVIIIIIIAHFYTSLGLAWQACFSGELRPGLNWLFIILEFFVNI